ncbi:MAG: hypothetical protein HYZ14_02365 [Bacteroidetes bacterium]|nr:hypothetical protein [Bacteroidota bacterium]
MKSGIVVFLFCLSRLSFGQDPKELRHVTTDLFYADFYILLESKKIRYVDTLDYYWFKSQAIHNSQGFSSGHVLNGPFIQYYISGQLAEQGQFEAGLKTGEWKTWYETGQLQSIENYENGVLEGNFFKYDPAGKITVSGSYKSGNFHGEIVENGTVTDYKNGRKREQKQGRTEEAAPEDGKEKTREEKKENREQKKDTNSESDAREKNPDGEEQKFSFKKLFGPKEKSTKKEHKPGE